MELVNKQNRMDKQQAMTSPQVGGRLHKFTEA
jgi:hypothetical protein